MRFMPTASATAPLIGLGARIHRRIHRVWALIRLPYEYAVLYGGLLLFTVAFFAWSAVATVLYALLPRGSGTQFGRRAAMVMFRSYLAVLKATGLFKFDLREVDALRDEGALVIAPNHPSLIDAVLIGSRLPRIACIMKSGIPENPILGGGSRLAGYIRDDPPVTMIRSATETLG